MKFSLMFFAASEDELIKDKYNLVIESAKYADNNGFASIWVPERHFIKFGYLYPNPAILQSALARETKHVRLMAGSVVAPLHDPIRVTEDWAMVDNLSGGRAGMSFAPGWNPDDFVFYPEKYKERHKEMYASIDVVKRLWEGGSITKTSGNGKQTDVCIYPKPIQKELPLWITAASNPESFIKAGELGANLLTHILDQEAQQLGEKITLYREALAKNGFDPKTREVTVMIHTFLGANAAETKEQARKPYCEYLKANRNIFAGLAQSRGNKVNPDAMSEKDIDDLVNFLYDRFASTRGFIGSPDNCFKLLDDLKNAGVDEVACLLDFGPHPDEILNNLPYIKILKQKYNGESDDDFIGSKDESAKGFISHEAGHHIKTHVGVVEKLNSIRGRCKETIADTELRNRIKQIGYGVELKHEILHDIATGINESIGKIVIPQDVFTSPGFSVYHSIFIDSCCHLFVCSLPEAFLSSEFSYYPSGFKSLNTYRPITRISWGHVLVSSSGKESDFIEGDVHILDDYGNLIATITSLQLKKINTGVDKAENVKSSSISNHAKPRLVATSINNAKRLETILSEVKTMIGGLLQIDASRLDNYSSFVEMGSDSLILAAVMNKIDKRYQVRISIRELFEEVNSLSLVAKYIDERLPQEKETIIQDEQHVDSEQRNELDVTSLVNVNQQPSQFQSSTSGQTVLEQIIKQQLDIMAQQIQALAGGGPVGKANAGTPLGEKSQSLSQGACSLPNKQRLNNNGSSRGEDATTTIKNSTSQPSIFPKKDFKNNDIDGYTDEQRNYLHDFIESFTRRTRKSKQLTQAYRHVLADNRASVGFRFSTKEMLYPIIGKSSEGSTIIDVDGNSYIDIAMGFGVNLFGHRPSFVTSAIEEQLKKGFQLGPQSDVAGEVAELVSELTGLDRVSFHNSGTEAVMTALRLARTVSRKNKTVIFAGSYHGHFDGTLVVAEDINENPQAIPMSVGIPQSMVDDVIVLEYGNVLSLETIRARANEIAAVLVEPVQSRKPDLQPKEFLKSLREITQLENIALIFDEMITGFRIHPGGAQAWFGVSADIATYGKIVGGGLPIGMIAGKSKFMDALDGGMWNFGDKSYPEIETTFFAGTFCKHPLAIASAKSVLQEIKRQGPELQQKLNEKTTYLANSLNTFFKENDLNIHVGHFSSLFYFSYTGNMDLFFYHLVHKGIYVWEGKTCFLSTAHSDEDVDVIISTIKDTLTLLVEKGFVKRKSAPRSNTTLHSSRTEQTKEQQRIPLTVSQRKLWISAQIEEGGSLNNIPVLIQLKGQVDVDKLEETLQLILNRHEALRTVFSEEGDYQVVLDKMKFKLPVINTKVDNENDTDRILEEWQLRNVNEPFDLVNGPLFKAELLKISPSHYFLFFVTHHLIADGWSTGIIIDEIGKIYSALTTGEELKLDPSNQFKEYIYTLQAMSQTPAMAKQEQYWLERFSVLPPVTEFEPDHAPQAMKTFKGKRLIKRLDAKILADMGHVVKEHQVSPYMFLLTTYLAMIHRVNKQHDIVVGLPLAARVSSTFYNMVGFCSNMMPIRSTIDSHVTFADLLKQTKDELMLVYENQDFSYGSLLDKIDGTRDLIKDPLMKLGFNFNPKINHPTLFDLEAKLIPSLVSYAENGLTLHLNEIDGGIVIECDYSTDLYDDTRIEGLLEIYSHCLRQAIDNPRKLVSEITLVSGSEKDKILNVWNNTQGEYPREPLHILFEQQVERTPKNVAIVFGDKSLNFEELNKAANRLAHHIRKTYAIKPNDLIGVMTERSEWMMISILAILKSGAAYVPIDTEYPHGRIQYILKNAAVKAIIADSIEENGNIFLEEISVIALKDDWKKISRKSAENPEPINTPKDLAYVIYTSGSTGNPKGVMIEHAGAVNRIDWMWKHYDFTTNDVIFQKTTFAFDVSVWEIFMPLCYGAKMVLCQKEVIYDPKQIVEHIHKHGITTLHFVPSMLSLFLDEINDKDELKLNSVRHVMASGEALPLQTVKKFYKKLKIPLHNLYGPTEASVDVSYHQTSENDSVIPIGRPITNIKLYVLDESLDLLPTSSIGEIAISGVGLSRGYLGLTALTHEKFRENPYEAGERLYLTGDIGRWLPNGEVEYLGRKDSQVKIKGNRIELEEIENVLSDYDGIKNPVALVIENDGNKELVACFVADEKFDEIEVRSYLGSRLPSFMIPSHLKQVDAVPLTSNGKIDRKALAALVSNNSERTFSVPRNEIEEKLLAIWKVVLERDDISTVDNFFSSGGQSLKAIQLLSNIHKEFGKKIDLRSVFLYPTISMLASYLENASLEKYEVIKPVAEKPHYDLSQSQKPLWLLAQVERDFKPYNMFKELLIKGLFSETVFEDTIRGIVSRHESLRTSFNTIDGVPKQFICPIDELKYDIRYIDGSNPETLREVLTNFAKSLSDIVFDLSEAPLFRISVIHLDNHTHIVSLAIHHIISDGLSNDILMKEISDAYSNGMAGRPPAFKHPVLNYKDYSEWENAFLASDAINIHKKYWYRKLDGQLPVLNLPLDKPRVKKTYEGAFYYFTIDESTSLQLRTFCSENNSTVFISLLSALNVLLYKYTGQQDIIVGTPVAGRTKKELEGLVGPFINSLPLRVSIDGSISFLEFMKMNRENVLEAHQHEMYPYVKLIEDLQLGHDSDRNPLFDVLIVWATKDDVFENVEALNKLKDLRGTANTSKLDLSLYMADDGREITVGIQYSTDLFIEETIAKMASDYTRLIKTFLIEPTMSVDTLKSTLFSRSYVIEQNAFEGQAAKVLSEEF